ncbi:ParB/RepB/Spo0J family partition protein [Azospirillum sp. sgz302134]
MSRNLLAKGKSAPAPDSSRQANGHALFVLAKGGPQIVEADIDKIVANPEQPRRTFDEEEIANLAASIETHGLQQPIGLQPLPAGGWQLAFGERRLRAVQRLGRKSIAGLIVSGDLAEIGLIENVQRVDLNPFEEAFAFDRLRQRHGYSHDALAKVVGRSKSMVTKTLMLLRLPEGAHERYVQAEDKPTFRAMYAVAALEDEQDRLNAWDALFTLPSSGEADVPEDGEADGRAAARQSPEPSEALSALSMRVARNLLRARDALNALRERPPSLMDSDREMLRDIRDAVDALLRSKAS